MVPGSLIADPSSTFDRVYVVNLDRRPDRWARFAAALPADWPFPAPQRWPAIDGQHVAPPAWWRAGRGAWGVYRSQLAILEQCLNDGVESVLILEDDALFCPDFTARVTTWLRQVPADWQMLYLGGQHLKPPRPYGERGGVSPPVLYQPQNVNRCHAWAVRGPMLQEVYSHLTTHDWPRCASGKPAHIDHHLGRLHQRHYDAGDGHVLCPPEWFIGQAADSQSNISSKKDLRDRYWRAARLSARPAGPRLTSGPTARANSARPAEPAVKQAPIPRPVIVVLGPFRGGTSCTAGVLHHLGVNMGRRWSTIKGNPKGTFEAEALAKFCRASYQEPRMTERTTRAARVAGLIRWAADRCRAIQAPAPIGAKHPALCLLIPDILEAWPEARFVAVHRPLAESVASLRKQRNWGWPAAVVEPTLRLLIETRDRDLAAVDPARVLHLDYAALVADPYIAVQQLVRLAGITPTPDQLAAAVAFVDPQLHTVCLTAGPTGRADPNT